MKKILLVLLCILLLSKVNYSQKKDNTSLVAAGAGLVAAGISAAVLVEQYKEYIELNATEYLLANYPNHSKISVSLLDFEGVKLNDFSNTTCVSLKVSMRKLGSTIDQKFVLMMFTSNGWINDYGINTSVVTYNLFDKVEWNKLISKYINIAIEDSKLKIINSSIVPMYTVTYKEDFVENDSSYSKVISTINNSVKYYKIIKAPISKMIINNRGIEVEGLDWQVNSDFTKIDGDNYLIDNYSNDFQVIYNENTLGLFNKNTKRLSQLRRSTLNKIHQFINN